MKMAEAAQAYLRHLEVEGKSPSTCGTTKRTLALVVDHFGTDHEIDKLAVQDLEEFFASEAATKQQGKPRAAASIAQIQRLVRAAFAWWRKQGEGIAAPTTEKKLGDAIPAVAPKRTTFLDLTYQGQPVRFAKSEIDRARLYGIRKLVAVDDQGHECENALLTRDGRYVLHPGSTADLYLNESGDVVARRDLVAADEARAQPSVSDKPGDIEGPLTAGELFQYVVGRVHVLSPVVVPAKLAEALGAGALFRVPQQRRSSVAETSAFLVGGETGAFFIQAEPHGFEYVGPEQPVLPADDSDEDDFDAFAFPDNFGDPHEPT
jgi:hypothetical protein